jgi:hypothetical protein
MHTAYLSASLRYFLKLKIIIKREIVAVGNTVEVFSTFIKPARQCKSTSFGTTPLFNWSLTQASSLFSPLILKIPSI